MIVKMFWEHCPEFVVEEEDAFFIEVTGKEAAEKVFPALSPQEKLKFEQMKDVYVAKTTNEYAREGSYYFLVTRGAHEIKFESVAFMSSDLSARGGKAWSVPPVAIESFSELDSMVVPPAP